MSSALVVTLGLMFLGIFVKGYREPFHNGKSLTEWAEQYRVNWNKRDKTLANEAQDAIQEIGTNAIPFLIQLVRTDEILFKKKLASIIPTRWHKSWKLVDNSGEKRRIGAYGLKALGTIGQSSLQELIDIASHHPNEDGRYIAVYAIRGLREAAEPAIPFLIQCLTNDVRSIRDDAALALGTMRLQPQVVVPALTGYLKAVSHTKAWELADAIFAVARFGTNATPATQLLTALLYHHDAHIRSEATNALLQVNPSMFVNRQLSIDAALGVSINRLKAALALDDSNPLEAINALTILGTNASPAVPMLKRLLNHSESSVRTAVTNALLAIAPVAAGDTRRRATE